MLALSGCGGGSAPSSQPGVGAGDYLIGAHYYSWFPSNFDQGYVRNRLVPAQEPWLGEYDSASPAVVEQHIRWASQHGIDFFAHDWWPIRPQDRGAIEETMLGAANIDDIRFCIFYETSGMGQTVNQFSGAHFDETTTEQFLSDMRYIAQTYFDHPSYLRVDGRPVVILYLTRVWSGDYAGAMAQARDRLLRMGHDPYIIGDEVFWVVTEHDAEPPRVLYDEPQVERIELFDAVTAYNPWHTPFVQLAGYGAESDFIEDVSGLYTAYRDATSRPFVPTVLPGYNDRGVRLAADHWVIPRRWSADDVEGSFLAHSLDSLALPFIDQDLRMSFITSFNEWNEDTAIEPAKIAPGTTRDDSESGADYSDGFSYTGYGLTHLEVVRDKVSAVWGQVTDGGSAGVPGVDVHAWRGELVVASERRWSPRCSWSRRRARCRATASRHTSDARPRLEVGEQALTSVEP